MTSPDVFFIFWKCWFSGELGRGGGMQGVKGKKGPKMTKTTLSLSISQELYLIVDFWYTYVN